MKSFLHLSGNLNVLSGALLLIFWYSYAVLLPYSQLENTLSILIQDRNWTVVNIFGSFGALVGIVGLVGLFNSLGEDISNLALYGFVVAIIGAILMFVALLRDTLLWPILVDFDPSLLDFNGPIYTSKTFVPFFIFSGAVYSIGYVLFGLALAKSGIYPVLSGHLLAWGALLFGLGAAAGNLQVVIRSIGITGLSAALIWLGFLLRLR